ncbi:TetR/AcrR family transcriptional regulator [Microbacterium aquimaris]|uniref:TetR/AcrR family transcriptional regulator n=1 Tax=Microbacterium aquimaris TaxID=459816 RepID=A0ABU5N502_9MICO|nr:TetR/AcrR family transcriptional regulator [Microbacterium aquimaris]MDZ8161183.1 TetR/AcrR family transcriptional regulator [Microbacterium aquimaris]
MTDSPERARLLGLTTDLILREGVVDMSLSAIARGIGSNNRMVLYYFGSKQDLLDEASRAAFDRFPRLRDMFTRLAADGPLEDRLLEVWEDLSAPENHAFLRLFFQQFGTVMRDQDGWSAFTDRIAHEWIDATAEVLRREGFDALGARTAAMQLVGLWRGLQFLTLTGVDPEELRAANRATVQAVLTRR